MPGTRPGERAYLRMTHACRVSVSVQPSPGVPGLFSVGNNGVEVYTMDALHNKKAGLSMVF